MNDKLKKLKEMMEKHTSHITTDLERSQWTSDHKFLFDTFITTWPKELCDLSIRQNILNLTLDESLKMAEWYFEARGDSKDIKFPFTDLVTKFVDDSLKMFTNGCFFRLNSRSPKDSYYGYKHGFKITNLEQAFQLICGSSMRMFDDWGDCHYSRTCQALILREWHEIPKWSEFRCFMENRKLIGISQYHYQEIFPKILENKETIISNIISFFTRFNNACHLDNIVFDIFFDNGDLNNIKLLEINPFHSSYTDPCCYKWNEFNSIFAFKN